MNIITFLLIPEVEPVARDRSDMPLCCSCGWRNLALPFFHLWQTRYHVHFSGARSHPVTWRISRKNCTMSCILVTNFSSLSVSYCNSTPVSSMSGSSFVAPQVVSSTNDSPGLICSSTPSTANNVA
jgi:hypothetical protein